MSLPHLPIFLFLLISLLTSHSSATELLEVPVGISPVMSSAAMFIAKERGYFREEGIDVVINPFKASGAKMVPFLATGQLFVAGGNVNAGMYNAIAQDIPIKIVADKGTVSPGHGYLALIVRKDHLDSGRYRDLKDLKGMTLAVTAKGVSQQIVIEKYLRKAGLILKDIKLVTLAYADMNIALANKSIDATVQIEPFVAVAIKHDFAVRVAGNDEIYPDQQSAVIYYSPIFMQQHPKQAQGFMNAYVRGLRDYNDAFEKGEGKQDIIRILTQSTRIKDASIYQAVVPVGLSPDGLVNIQSLKADAQWYYQQGYLKAMPDVDTIVDLSYARMAVKKLGDYP
ncbi:MAG: ABC transporter substrate-binding protein [Gammaproteobacteria bacterium]|nr:ABC transporter substrate-binding protein [Gammaproteobacteria bacterium]MCF6259326.1 ABC transporter substrate-binding protein [Gammaproteobacteria bacterium]